MTAALTYRTLTPVHERNLVRRYCRGIERAGAEFEFRKRLTLMGARELVVA